jgi:transcriptional regulator with XRE-family HTH domain
MSARKTPAQYIRETVFGLKSQREFAQLLGYEQATISRFENGSRRLNVEAQLRIRAAAKKQRLQWDDSWFFDVPKGGGGERSAA